MRATVSNTKINNLTTTVDNLKGELDKYKINPILNKGDLATIYPQYGDHYLTSDTKEQYLSFAGLSAEIGRIIYVQTRKRVYLYTNRHSFFGLPKISEDQYLSNNTTYRFVRSGTTSWLVTSSYSPYPYT